MDRLTIGGVKIEPGTVLAPMAGVTDTIFRRFIHRLGGCGLIMTEFTSSDGITRDAKRAEGKTRFSDRYLAFTPEERPITAQLFGSSAEVIAEAAALVESR